VRKSYAALTRYSHPHQVDQRSSSPDHPDPSWAVSWSQLWVLVVVRAWRAGRRCGEVSAWAWACRPISS
jgi:hypothetical protein